MQSQRVSSYFRHHKDQLRTGAETDLEPKRFLVEADRAPEITHVQMQMIETLRFYRRFSAFHREPALCFSIIRTGGHRAPRY